jgi:hypothetical protein
MCKQISTWYQLLSLALLCLPPYLIFLCSGEVGNRGKPKIPLDIHRISEITLLVANESYLPPNIFFLFIPCLLCLFKFISWRWSFYWKKTCAKMIRSLHKSGCSLKVQLPDHSYLEFLLNMYYVLLNNSFAKTLCFKGH